MKKTFFYTAVIIFFCLCVTICELHGRELVVNGRTVDVGIPTGMSAEDAFYEAFQLYLEAEDDCTKLLKSLEDTNSELRELKGKAVAFEENATALKASLEEVNSINARLKDEYKALSEDYEELSKLYKKMSRPTFLRPFVGLGLNTDKTFTQVIPSLHVGGVVLDRLVVDTNIEYNIFSNDWRFGLQVGLGM